MAGIQKCQSGIRGYREKEVLRGRRAASDTSSEDVFHIAIFSPCIFRVNDDWWMIVFGIEVAYFVV